MSQNGLFKLTIQFKEPWPNNCNVLTCTRIKSHKATEKTHEHKSLTCHVMSSLDPNVRTLDDEKIPRKKNKVTTSSFIDKLSIIGHILHQNLAWVVFCPWHHFLLTFFLNSLGAEVTSPRNLSAKPKTGPYVSDLFEAKEPKSLLRYIKTVFMRFSFRVLRLSKKTHCRRRSTRSNRSDRICTKEAL